MSYHNGDPVIESCYFCGIQFASPEKLGGVVKCQDENGLGCGMVYTIKVGALKPAPKKELE